jgi:hypothetical protein
MAEKGAHKKKKSGKKAAKKKASAEGKRKRAAGDGDGPSAAEMARNPKAFTNKSRGRAKLQRARTADKEQKRMHGVIPGKLAIVAAWELFSAQGCRTESLSMQPPDLCRGGLLCACDARMRWLEILSRERCPSCCLIRPLLLLCSAPGGARAAGAAALCCPRAGPAAGAPRYFVPLARKPCSIVRPCMHAA